jgi:hypothetical protein
LHFSCSNCARIRCEGSENHVYIRLIHNGKNAVFGSDAFIDRDSIRLFIPVSIPGINYPDIEFPITYVDSTQSLRLSLSAGHSQFLSYPGSIDTFYGNYSVTQWTECCDRHMLVSLLWNEEKICTDGCEDVIEIGI